jgi:N-acetylmuramoyl-L-alanine amidase
MIMQTVTAPLQQKRRIRLFGLLLGLLAAMPALAADVAGVRLWSGPEGTRLVFDVSDAVDHKVFSLHEPDRVVIDLLDTRAVKAISGLDLNNSLVSQVRSAVHNGKDLRVVLDLKDKVRPKSFLLKPTQQYGHRLVIDLQDVKGVPATRVTRDAVQPDKGELRDLIIAIDAGHGGEDPGALGSRGTREKDVVLEVARRFEKLVQSERGMKPVMIRSGDYYVSLRKRMEMARELRADLFVSIHADAFQDGRARGASVYVLSQKGASSEAARWLAESENNADLIGGVSLDGKDDLLASVLLDLSQNATIAASLDVGGEVLKELQDVGAVHKLRVEQAGFVVLKSPDIPSILVETGFISNPREEHNLRDDRYQEKLARAMLKGVRAFFTQNPPPGTLLASIERRHIIQRGETLSSIAQRYQISHLDLRSANNLTGDILKIGQTLRIPVM